MTRPAEVLAPEAAVEMIVTGLGATEGTVWHQGEQALVFSEMVQSRVYRWTAAEGATVLRMPSNITNGNTFDRQGRLICCEHATSCVSRLEEGGRWVRVLASHYQGRPFNSPNDVVVDSQDRIWFTDADYGRTSARVGVLRPLEMGFKGVFRLDPDGTVTLVADDFIQPNGLCFTPDERHLLVNDTTRGHVRRFAVSLEGGTSGGAVLAEISGEGAGRPDGMKVDADGRIYVTGPGGIHVLRPDGAALGVIATPALTRNFCFGGPDGRTLFLAMEGGIGRLPIRVAGVLPQVGA